VLITQYPSIVFHVLAALIMKNMFFCVATQGISETVQTFRGKTFPQSLGLKNNSSKKLAETGGKMKIT
jgi:hypothetical protein